MKKILFFFTILIFNIISVKSQDAKNFEHSMWQWFEAANVSKERLNEFAPHFPFPENSNYDREQYDQAIFRWQKLYCFEYEAFVNAPELVKLNPYYDGYQDIIQLPYFFGPLESEDKPIAKSTGNAFEDKLDYELAIQNWYYVFKPDEFVKLYGEIDNQLPFWFNPDVYRNQIKTKIEANKNVSKEDYKN